MCRDKLIENIDTSGRGRTACSRVRTFAFLIGLAGSCVTVTAGPATGATLVKDKVLAPKQYGHLPRIDSEDLGRAVATWVRKDGTAMMAGILTNGRWGPQSEIARGVYDATPLSGPNGDVAIMTETPSGIYMTAWGGITRGWMDRRITRSANDEVVAGAIDTRGRVTLLVGRWGGTAAAPIVSFRVYRGSTRLRTLKWKVTARPLRPALGPGDDSLALDVGRTGVTAIAWRTPAGVVRVTRTVGAAPFEAPLTLATDPTVSADVAVNKQGDIALAWARRGPDGWTDGLVKLRTAGTTTWPTNQFKLPLGLAPHPAIGSDRAVGFAVGTIQNGQGAVRMAVTPNRGGFWTEHTTPVGGCACVPQINHVLLGSALYVGGSRRGAAGTQASSQGFVTAFATQSATQPAAVVYPVLGSVLRLSGMTLHGSQGGLAVIWGRTNALTNAPIRAWTMRLQ